MTLQLGSLVLGGNPPLILAPLAGYSDAAFRAVCRLYGVDATVSEMASADGLALARRTSKGFRKTISMLAAEGEDHPFGVQLFGKEPERLAEACRVVTEAARPEWIDLNAGCPVRKVVASGHGVALMRDPAALGRVVAAMRAATALPLTVKLRAGAETINVVECARVCEAAGADGVIVHPRTRGQMFAGHADWSLIGAVKRAVAIPVVGNGDVDGGAAARRMAAETGCDGIMIGRAAVTRPWVFAEVRAALAGETPPAEPDMAARLAHLRRHIELLTRHKGAGVAAMEIRKFALFLVRGVPGAAAARQAMSTAPNTDELLAIVAGLSADDAPVRNP